MPDNPLYKSHRWQKARAAFLQAHPLCRLCEDRGRITLATVVDHITPHKGDLGMFWDTTNWQPLCATCHSGAKRTQEQSGYLKGCGRDGVPLDPHHPWNA